MDGWKDMDMQTDRKHDLCLNQIHSSTLLGVSIKVERECTTIF